MIEELKKILADKDAYDLVSAIRGNDYRFWSMKYIFTARIRYFLGIGSWAGDIRDKRYISEEEVESFKREVEEAIKVNMGSHYFDHILGALYILKNLKYMPEDEATQLQELVLATDKYMWNQTFHTKKLMYEALDKITVGDGKNE